jgi:hypothetical protein
MSDTEIVNKKATDLQIKQAIAKRKHRSESVWLAKSFEEAEANANLFVKAQIPLGTKDRNRDLSRAFDRSATAWGNRT